MLEVYINEATCAVGKRWSDGHILRLGKPLSDGLALSIALNATLIMPKLVCTCDRYWGFLENCRMPTAPPFSRRCRAYGRAASSPISACRA